MSGGIYWPPIEKYIPRSARVIKEFFNFFFGVTKVMESTASPTRFWSVCTPSDTVNFADGECNYIYVGTTGNVVAICNGAAVTFNNLPVGYHPIRCTRINATNTTASNILLAN